MAEQIPWVYYVSGTGRQTVLKEIQKLTLSERELFLLDELLHRISRNATLRQDIDLLGRGIWEARLRLQHRRIRVLYAENITPRVLLALLAAVKKTQKTPPQWINTALARHKDWLYRLDAQP